MTTSMSNGVSLNNDKQQESSLSQPPVIHVHTDGTQQSSAPGQCGSSMTSSSGDRQSSSAPVVLEFNTPEPLYNISPYIMILDIALIRVGPRMAI